MGLKILHSADWHLDSPFGGFSSEQREGLKAAQRKLPGMITELCRREACDLVLLSGDLFDGACREETVRLVLEALEACAVPVFISPGNHDFCTPGSPWLDRRWPENVHIFKGAPESVSLPELNCRVYGAGYQSMDCPGLLEGFRTEGTEKLHIGVFHGDPMTPTSPYCPITTAQVRGSGLDYLALGHIHKAGSFRAGKTLCAWPGCPMGRGWDETGEKGVYIAEFGDDVSVRQVLLPLPRFYDLEAEENTLEEVLPGGASGDFYRVALTGCGGTALEDIYEKHTHLPNLTLLDRREPEQDLWENVEEDTLEGTFFRLLKERMEASAPEDAALARMAAEISRKLLAGKEVALP